MTDNLYDRDIRNLPERHAGLSRRVGRGEPVNGIDRAYVVEEIEDTGPFRFNAV